MAGSTFTRPGGGVFGPPPSLSIPIRRTSITSNGRAQRIDTIVAVAPAQTDQPRTLAWQLTGLGNGGV